VQVHLLLFKLKTLTWGRTNYFSNIFLLLP